MSDDRTLDELLRIAARASAAIARVYATDFAVEYKAAHDPVTIADREANGIICEELAKSFPGVPVVAEESDPSTYARWRESDAVFFVDPLDGTRDFVKKNGEFAVMIGLAEGGRAKLGAIHAPATGRRFGGGVNVPTFELTASGTKKPLRVSSTAELSEARLVLSRSRPSEELVRIANDLGVKSVAPLGSAGIKALAVATAAAEIYSHLGQAGWRWDACGPEAIVIGAGGRTSDARGDAIDYRAESLENKSGIVMSNGFLHDDMIKAIDNAIRAIVEKAGSS
ncbi:3'(2'),5'-bisphosphate nucleotidase CysQ [Pendulispora brunnea]|uniref:3'(2'),5-bisphosphonucleoside 3'(2')-phosphohydrolase n=1 Tax=Pendulispora brunnea TaxID=2905690 RepID=A0ABZ2K1R5_9BACT